MKAVSSLRDGEATFAILSRPGTVRVNTPKRIQQELESSKEDYISANFKFTQSESPTAKACGNVCKRVRFLSGWNL
ncbi:hypothetical protein Bca101_060080 [Brassica carinata]